jgi:hypothetical protein
MSILIYKPFSIPLTEVELVYLRKVDALATTAATIGVSIGGIVLGYLGLVALISILKESCPFIYSYDGDSYVFDAEPYGGATCPGLKRMEWCGLQYLQESDGQYKLLVTNEVEETQYTDEIKLLVIDHPEGTSVIPDESGCIHTISEPVLPFLAYDKSKRNLLPYISENDWIFWKIKEDEISTFGNEYLKEELIFEFLKPAGATETKVLFNGCNTLWASQMVRKFLELHGSDVHEYYEKHKNPSYQFMINAWNNREELFRLHLRVETLNGWKSKNTIVGGGPFVAENKVYSLDLSDVPGDTVRIKLTPPANFWMINYIALDFTENIYVYTTEIEASEAYDHNNKDVLKLLAHTDDNYLVMPNIGDWTKLTFFAPPRTPGMDRSVVLKASGYYDIHLNAQGPCQKEIVNRIAFEPGFSIQYALEEYSQWKNELQEKKIIK